MNVAIFEDDMTLDEFIEKYKEVVIEKVGIRQEKLASLSVKDVFAFNLFLAGKGLKFQSRKIIISAVIVPEVHLHDLQTHYSHN